MRISYVLYYRTLLFYIPFIQNGVYYVKHAKKKTMDYGDDDDGGAYDLYPN